MSYQKIGPDHPSYDRIKAIQEIGSWVCDSIDHNGYPDESEFCSNPECFKSKNPPAHWKEMSDNLIKIWEEMKTK